jgi:hypothetical protein
VIVALVILLSVIVALVILLFVIRSTNSRTLQCLALGDDRQNAKNHWNARVQLNPHEGMRNGVTNVLKVHGFTLDENTDRDDCVKRGFGHVHSRRWGTIGGGGPCESIQTKQVCNGRSCLYEGACNDSTQRSSYASGRMADDALGTREGELVAAWNRLYDDVGSLDARCLQL